MITQKVVDCFICEKVETILPMEGEEVVAEVEKGICKTCLDSLRNLMGISNWFAKTEAEVLAEKEAKTGFNSKKRSMGFNS